MSAGSEAEQYPRLESSSGFGPLPNSGSRVPSNIRRTITAARGSSSSMPLELQDQRRKQSVSKFLESESSGQVLTGIPRKRGRPQILDPSPPPARNLKRRPGRPPRGGRRGGTSSSSLLELGTRRELQALSRRVTRSMQPVDVDMPQSFTSEENHLIPPLHAQSGEQSLPNDTSPLIHQQIEQAPKDLAVESQQAIPSISAPCGKDVHKSAISQSLPKEPVIANTPRCGPVNDETHPPNNLPTQVNDSLPHYLANASNEVGEIHSTTNDLTTQVGLYEVSRSLAPILQYILRRHGDIAKDCTLESNYLRNPIMEVICKVIRELQIAGLARINKSMLDVGYRIVKDVEKINLNVEWLRELLDDIQEAQNLPEKIKELVDDLKERSKIIEDINASLQVDRDQWEKLEASIEEHEVDLVKKIQESEDLSLILSNLEYRLKNFQRRFLMD